MKRRALIAGLAALSASAFGAPLAHAIPADEDEFRRRGRGGRDDEERDRNEGRRDWQAPDAGAQPAPQQRHFEPPPDDGGNLRGGPREEREDWGERRQREWRGRDNPRQQDQDRGAQAEQPGADWRSRARSGGDWNSGGRNNGAEEPRHGEWNGRRDGEDEGDDWSRRDRGEWNRDDRGRNGEERRGDWSDRGRDGGRDHEWRGRDRGEHDRGDRDWGREDRGGHGRDRYHGSNDWGRDWNGRHRGNDWRRWDWNRDHHNYARWRHTHRDFHRPRYNDWRHVRHGYYFDNGYRSIVRLFFGWDYYWWSYPNWRRPYRPWRVGYYLPDYIWWEPVPYDLYWRLPPAPYGCRYIMIDRDILLISVVDGLILDALLHHDPYDRYARY